MPPAMAKADVGIDHGATGTDAPPPPPPTLAMKTARKIRCVKGDLRGIACRGLVGRDNPQMKQIWDSH